MTNNYQSKLAKRTLAFCLSAVVFVAACSQQDRAEGISGSGSPVIVASGPISGFGSIIVNGERFDTRVADFFVDGQSAEESDFLLGQDVYIEADSVDGGEEKLASNVHFDAAVQGPVTSIDTLAGTVSLLNQTVLLTAETLSNLDGSILSNLITGQMIRVSGLRNQLEQIEAERIDTTDSSVRLLSGTIESLDRINRRFSIAGTLASYPQSMDDSEFSNGLPVQVAVSAPTIDSLDTLQLTSVRAVEPREAASEGTELRLLGSVRFEPSLLTPSQLAQSHASALTQFFIDQWLVVVTDDTTFANGTVSDLDDNSRITVEGTLTDAKLILSRVEFSPRADTSIEATVSTIAALNNTPVPVGSITLESGLTVQLISTTRYQDTSEFPQRGFNLTRINPGDQLIIHYYTDNTGALITTSVNRLFASVSQ